MGWDRGFESGLLQRESEISSARRDHRVPQRCLRTSSRTTSVSASRTALGGDDINTRCALASWSSAGPGLNFNKGLTNPLPVYAAAKFDQAEMREERRLVWRVLRQWKGIADGGRFPRRDEIDPWLQGEDGANCLLIAVGWSVEFSRTVVVVWPSHTLRAGSPLCRRGRIDPRNARTVQPSP